MRKARKLLSFLILMVFVIPFIPSTVVSVSGVEGASYNLSVLSGNSYTDRDTIDVEVQLSGLPDDFDFAGHMVYLNIKSVDSGTNHNGIFLNYDEETSNYKHSMPVFVGGVWCNTGEYVIDRVEIMKGYSEVVKGWEENYNFSVDITEASVQLSNSEFSLGGVPIDLTINTGFEMSPSGIEVFYENKLGRTFVNYEAYDEPVFKSVFSTRIEPGEAGDYIITKIVLKDGRESNLIEYGWDTGTGIFKMVGDKGFYVYENDYVLVTPTVSNVESYLKAGAVNGVGTWWAGLALDLDKGTYGDIKYIDALWAISGVNASYGEETLRVRLEADKTGRFVGDTQLHRFYKEGKYELLDLELRNSAGEMVYWVARKEGTSTDEELLQYLSGGDITLGAENFVGFDPKKCELKVTPVKDVFIDGEALKFNFSMQIPDGVVFPFKYAFVEVFGTEMDEAEFIRVEWDSVKRVFNVKDFKNRNAMKYYGVDVYFSNNPNEVISGNRVEDAIRVPLLPNLNFTVKAVEDTNIEDLFNKGEEVYEAIEEAIAKLDPTVPEEKAKMEELEKVLRDIDTTKKAVEPIVEKEAPKFVFGTDNLRALKIEEARDPNVKNISVEVDFEVKTPEEIKELVGEGTAIIGLYDMSLIKRVIKNDDSKTVGTIGNEDILEKITLRIPISRELSERDLKVVYVDDNGKITELETRLVKIGEEGKEDFYLQFETDHFSMYGILDVTEPEAPVEEPETPVENPETPEEPETPVVNPDDNEGVTTETPSDNEEENEEAEKEEDTLPKAGSGAVWMYTLSGLALAGAGTFGLKKERK